MIILGIDPGSHTTGYAFIEQEHTNRTKIRVLEYGAIKARTKAPLFERLGTIRGELLPLVQEYHPHTMAMETSFYAKSVLSAMTLGHARGAIMSLCFENNMRFAEYAPREIKQRITGTGSASKAQVALLMQQLLGLRDIPQPEDASDALAVAYTFLQENHAGLV
jgi:crossover junction endodeoxyribonuclease RuvC